MSQTLEAALVDVRKAYRLLADYQQRIIELLGFMRDDFGAVQYSGYTPNKPKGFSSWLEQQSNAGLMFLPLLDATTLWIRCAVGQKEDGRDYVHRHVKGDMLIDVTVLSDTGFTDKSADPQAREFPEHSTSGLAICIFHCDEPASEEFNWFHKVWNEFEYPKYNEVGECEEAPGYRAYREFIPLTALADKDMVKARVQEFCQNAKEKLRIEF